MTMLKEIAKRALPRSVFEAGKRMWIFREATALRDRCSRESSIGSIIDVVMASPDFRADQKKGEISQLLELLRARQPRYLCEVGGRVGGSLALFAQVAAPAAQILSIDLDYKPGQTEALSGFARAGQSITCVAADSHLPATADLVREWLRGESLDFLLIDGDHSFEGVERDFVMYSPFVKAGGIIAFHDIVPDSKTRTGIETASYAGGVPILWQNLKRQGLRVEEFVDSWDQDGFGIGVVHWDSERSKR